MSTLLRTYTARHFVDASQETPGQHLEEDLTPAEVRAEPDPGRRKVVRDKWERRADTLVRIHGTPRLTLFTPDKLKSCPVKESSFTGKRRTFVQASGSSKQQLIEDDYKAEFWNAGLGRLTLSSRPRRLGVLRRPRLSRKSLSKRLLRLRRVSRSHLFRVLCLPHLVQFRAPLGSLRQEFPYLQS